MNRRRKSYLFRRYKRLQFARSRKTAVIPDFFHRTAAQEQRQHVLKKAAGGRQLGVVGHQCSDFTFWTRLNAGSLIPQLTSYYLRTYFDSECFRNSADRGAG